MHATKLRQHVRYLALLVVGLLTAQHVIADEDFGTQMESLKIAVATNFAPALNEIALEFTTTTNIGVKVVTGSTGKLYAQIMNGLDVDLFLAADQVRIRRLVDDGLTLNDTLTTYAVGRLVWWHPGAEPIIDSANRLEIGNDIKVIAYAQPELAPYGKAAEEALSKCFSFDGSRVRFVHGENAGQTYAHVATGNADAGLVALASIKLAESEPKGGYTSVPVACHEPIKQDAVVLKSSRNETTARRFLQFLRNEGIQRRVAEYGYTLP